MKTMILIQCMVHVLLHTSCEAWRTFKIIVEDSSIEMDERYVSASIQIVNDFQNESSVSMYVNVLEDIDNIMSHVSLTAKTTSDEHINLLNATGNFCRFLVGRKDGNVRLFFESIQKSGNIFSECPIRKGSYYLHDFKFDPDLTPDYLPESTFLATAHVYFNDLKVSQEKSIIKFNMTGKIDKSQGLDNLKVFSMG